jgi:hypothetical protein
MPHDPITANRIKFLCESILLKPSYKVLTAPNNYVRNIQLQKWDLDSLNTEFKVFETELFVYGILPTKAFFYLQPDGRVALSGYEHFAFKMLRPDGSWYSQEPEN